MTLVGVLHRFGVYLRRIISINRIFDDLKFYDVCKCNFVYIIFRRDDTAFAKASYRAATILK